MFALRTNQTAESYSLVGVSDVTVGYGSPEVPLLMDSLARHLGTEALLIQPDEISRPPTHGPLFPSGRVHIRHLSSYWETYSRPFAVEYLYRAARLVNRMRPRVLVIFAGFSFPLLAKLNFRPELVIYHCYEVASRDRWSRWIHRLLGSQVDIITFPEPYRAIYDTQQCRWHGVPKVLLYNCGTEFGQSGSVVVPWDRRNGRILYSGTISPRVALSEYFWQEPIPRFPIDLTGRIVATGEHQAQQIAARLTGSLRYFGLLEPEQLASMRPCYAYSLLMWNPEISPNHRWAAPNRLFQSIQAGVPPIAAPHPQCREIIRRYDCGLLMRDWSFDAFRQALEQALAIYGTPRYEELVRNCLRATRTHLNWEAQFRKLVPLVDRHLKQRRMRCAS